MPGIQPPFSSSSKFNFWRRYDIVKSFVYKDELSEKGKGKSVINTYLWPARYDKKIARMAVTRKMFLERINDSLANDERQKHPFNYNDDE